MDDTAEAEHLREHKEYFRDILVEIHQIMEKEYGLTKVSIKPIGSEGSRLSIPIKIEGWDKDGKKVRYFGKIVGSSDRLTARTIQLFKNMYLNANSMESMFAVNISAEELARNQHDMLLALHKLGIPTAKPHGIHGLRSKHWLLVLDFLNARPITEVEDISEEHLDTVFGYLRKMHDNDIYHGDIKPDNLMFGDKVYIVDVGNFSKEASNAHKKHYDLACQIASFLDYRPAKDIVRIALRYYSRRELRAAAKFLDLVQKRPDINLSDERKEDLLRLLS